MLIRILEKVVENNDARLRVKLILAAASTVWERRFDTIGAAQVVFPNTEQLRREIIVGRYMAVGSGLTAFSVDVMYIASVRLTDTQIWAYGKEFKSLYLRKGLVKLDRGGEVDVNDAITDVLAAAPIAVVDLQSTVAYDMGDANIDDLEYNNVYDFVQGCLDLTKGGFLMKLEDNGLSAGKIVIRLRQGLDVSDTVRFGKALGNARDITYTDDDTEDYNTAVVVGEDTDGNIVTETVTKGDNIVETWSVVVDVRSEYSQHDESAAEYRAGLHSRGEQYLEDHKRKYVITVGSASAEGLGDRFQLGDTVGVDMPNGLGAAKARVVGYRRTSERGTERHELLLDDIEPV